MQEETPKVSALEKLIRESLGAALLPDEGPEAAIARIDKEGTGDEFDYKSIGQEKARKEVERNAEIIAAIDNRTAALKARKAGIDQRLKMAASAKERLRNDTRHMMRANALDKVKGLEATVSIAEVPGRLFAIIDAEAMENVHPQFVRVKKEIDIMKAKAHFQTLGEIPEGFDVSNATETLKIRR